MFVFVKGVSGKVMSLEMEGEDTIAHLKKKLEDKLGVPVDEQRIVFAAKPLYNDNTLTHYGIRQGCMLHLVLRLRGGDTTTSPIYG